MLQNKYLGIFLLGCLLCNKKLCVYVSSSSQQSSQSMSGCWLEAGQWTRQAGSRCFSLYILYFWLFLQEAGSEMDHMWRGSAGLIRFPVVWQGKDDWTGTGSLSARPSPAWADKLLVPPAKTINQQLDGAADSCWTPRQLTAACGAAVTAAWLHGTTALGPPPPTIIALSAIASPSHHGQTRGRSSFSRRVSASKWLAPAPSHSHPFQLGTSTLNFKTIILSDPNISFDFCILNILDTRH